MLVVVENLEARWPATAGRLGWNLFGDSRGGGTGRLLARVTPASLQIPERKRPVRHAVLLSKAFFETTLGANNEARRTVLFDESSEFVLHRLAVRFGLPVLPEWADWFGAELQRRGMVEELIGLNCNPIAVKGTKLRLLRILSQGLRRKAIEIPGEVPMVAGARREFSSLA